ncbi:coiled-coil domain-containing protein 39-like [Conger conger]|uniref:coiled-coil domain-containing protein 39-like n=1 Tax=Conger conger TaxID=82655 RepID=UPI002A5A806B|nr:coiled-coil domain-containing protein 39-like [Conger conger]
MVHLKNITESLGETAESDKSELRMKYLDERAMARLKQEIAQVELETEDLGKRRNEQKKAILRAGQKAEALQRELAEGREVLDSLRQDTVRCEEDYAVLMKCMQEDQCRTVNVRLPTRWSLGNSHCFQGAGLGHIGHSRPRPIHYQQYLNSFDSSEILDLLLRIKKQSIEAKQKHEVLDKDWEKTASMERQWESTEEAILQLCQERKALTNHWKTSVSHMTKRHQDMDQCIMSLSVVKEEVEQKRGAVKMAEETLESSRRRSAAASRLLEAVRRQAAELEAGLGERESQSTALCGECEVLRRAVDRANTEVKMAESLLAELTADTLANKDRLEKARLHSAALEEKLTTEMEVLVRGKEEAERAEQEVMKEEQANKDADARFYGRREALSQKAGELQALRREVKEQQAEVSAGRGALSTVSRKQRETQSVLTRKLEAVGKQDSRMELLERRMQELGAGEDRKQELGAGEDRKQELGAGVDRERVELLKEQAAKISMDVEERRRTLRHGEQQNLEGKLRLAKREVERLAWEGQDLSCKVEDLRLATAAAERELSETAGQRPELMVREYLLAREVKEARDRLRSGKDRIVALETQRLLLAAEFKGKVSELNLRKEVVQVQIKQLRQGCQKTSVERSRQRCKVQKLRKRHEAIAAPAIFPEGEEVSLRQYKAEVTRQREELRRRKEDLNGKLTVKRGEVTALKSELSARVRGV